MTVASGRDGFGQALVDLGAQNHRVVALTADLAESVRVHWFAEKYPERFFQIGIAEQDMIGTAAGLALTGLIPFATTFAVFAAHRANEQIRLACCYNRANVKIAVSHGGVTVGEDGATHQALEDIAAMRVLPEMTVLVPADAAEARLATIAAAELEGPVYLRLGRTPVPTVTDGTGDFTIGKAKVLRAGRDATVIACGVMVGVALEAADRLSREGISVGVVNMHTIKPLDVEAVVRAAEETGCVVTAEEHSVLGGLGSAVCEALAERAPVPVVRVGTRDTFGESGTPDELLRKYGLTCDAVEAAVKLAVAKKESLSAVHR
ncbi:MAG: transketolase family protein [Thermoflavifilum sp.]|nr:transketolase family protein [Thermoflavifilum sp.]MCL6514588.1 transketolase family protein [Alicyclobacillus sp.]